MSSPVVVPTGSANLASVLAALTRLGARPVLASGANSIEVADHVVVPGVGSFVSAAEALSRSGLGEAVAARIERGQATLAVCVGMQLLGVSSEESPGSEGLGIVDEKVTRFEGPIRVPQLGWNTVNPAPKSRFIEPGWAYFANSYRISSAPDGWLTSTTDYGGEFVSAMERGDVLACQFHPELSGRWGADLLRAWLDGGKKS